MPPASVPNSLTRSVLLIQQSVIASWSRPESDKQAANTYHDECQTNHKGSDE